MTTITQAERVTLARTRLLLDHPWFGVLSLRLAIHENVSQETMQTNGSRLDYNPEWTATLTDGELMGLIAHEVGHCLTPDTLIMTERGLQPISGIREGDRVWSGRGGYFTRVQRIGARQYNGELVSIRPAFGPTIRITPEHRMLVSDKGSEAPNHFLESGQIDPSRHMLVFPIPQGGHKSHAPRWIGRSRSHFDQQVLRLDAEMAELIGWFVAEGNLAKPMDIKNGWFGPKTTKRVINWTLSLNDPYERLVSLIEAKLRRKATVQPIKGKQARRVIVSAKTLANFLTKNFYDGKDKAIPAWMLSESEPVIRGFIAGYAAGDGSRHGDFTTTTSVSASISGMLPLLLLRLGYRPTVHPTSASAGAYPNARSGWRITWANRREVDPKRGDYLAGNRWYVPIKSITREPYTGQVHNIATASQSYSLPFAGVHNCAFQHPYRTGDRDLKRFNRACDLALNPLLISSGLTLPKDALIDPQYETMSAEQIYALLQKEDEEQGDPSGANRPNPSTDFVPAPDDAQAPGAGQDGDQSGNGPGDQDDNSAAAEQEPQMSATDWQIAAEQAANVTRKAGGMSADVERAINQSRESELDWKTILRRFIENTVASDYSWTSPNRRYVASGIYLPGVVKENIGHIAVAVDTSGSIDQRLLDQFASELTAIMLEARPSAVDVVYCDSRVRGTETFTPDDGEINLEARGGGGTRFQPVMDWIADQDEPPIALVYATDLASSDTPSEPSCPTLWLTPEWVGQEGPFGETVRIPATTY